MRDLPIVMVSFRCFEDRQKESGLYVPVLKTAIGGRLSRFSGDMEADPFRSSHGLIDSLVDACERSKKCASFILGENEKELKQDTNVYALFPVFTANVLKSSPEDMMNAGIGIQCYTASVYTMKRFSEKLSFVSSFRGNDSPLHADVCAFAEKLSANITDYCAPILKEIDITNRRASMRVITP